MALLLIEGFEGYNDVEEMEVMRGYSLASSGDGFGFDTGRNGGKAFKRNKLTGYGGYRTSSIAINPTHPTVVLGFALKIEPLTDTSSYFQMYCGSLAHATFYILGNSVVCKRKYNTANEYILGSCTISAGEWCYFELKYYAHNTLGYIEFRINEQTIATYSGDTYYDSYPSSFKFPIGYLNDTYMDDLYILDDSGSENNDFLGDIRIDIALPNGAGNYTQLTPSAGNNYECVDESLFDDSDYAYSADVGDKDSYTYQDVPTDLDDAAIYAIALNSSCKRTVAANNIQLKNMVRQGGSDYSQTAQSLSDSFTTKQDILIKDPSDSNPWTKAKINSAEFGVEVS